MKNLVPFVLLLLAMPAFCLEIQASVSDAFTTEMKYFNFNSSSQRFDAEVFNTGSIPYTAQLLVEVSNETYSFRGWAGKKGMMPGNNAVFSVYWQPEAAGEYKAKARIYYSGETLEKEFNISVPELKLKQSVFSIESARTYRKFIMLKMRSSEDVSQAAVIPDKYPMGWVMEQASLKNIKKGEERTVLIFYDPSVWSRQKVTFGIASADGKYFSSGETRLERERGLDAMIHDIIFSVFKD